MPSGNAIRSYYIDVETRSDQAISELQQTGEAADQTAESFEGAEDASAGLARQQEVLGQALAGTATVAASTAVALQQIAQHGSQIEQTFSVVETTSGATAEQMAEMRDTAAQIGAEMPLSTQQAAQALEQLSYAGFSAEESIAAVDSVSRLAVAGQLQLAESSRIVSQTLNAFQMDAGQAGAVADTMAATFASSATTIQELGQSLSYVGNMASAAGQDVTTVNAALGTMADAGLEGSRAGTSLQQALSRLASPTGAASDALEQVGLSAEAFTDEEGNFRSMNEIVSILADNMEDLGSAERMQVLTDIFGQEAARGMSALIDNVDEFQQKTAEIAAADFVGSIEELEDIDPADLEERLDGLEVTLEPGMNEEQVIQQFVDVSDQLSQEELEAEIQASLNVDEQAAGILASDIEGGAGAEEIASGLDDVVTSSDLVDSRMDTLAGQIEYLRGSIGAFGYTIYQTVEPAMMALAGVAVTVIDFLNEHEAIAKAVGISLLGIGSAATVATGALATLYGTLKLYTMWKASAAAGGALFQTVVYAEAAAAYVAAGGFTAAASALWAFLAPLWPFIAAGAALIGIVAAIATNAFGLRDALTTLLGPFWDLITAVGNLVGSLLGLGLDLILYQFRSFASIISGVVSAGQDLLNWFDGLSGPARAAIIGLVAVVSPLLGLFFALREAADLAAGAFNWAASGIDKIRSAVQSASKPLELLKDLLETVIGLVPDLPSAEDIPIVGGLFGGGDGQGQGGEGEGPPDGSGGPSNPPAGAEIQTSSTVGGAPPNVDRQPDIQAQNGTVSPQSTVSPPSPGMGGGGGAAAAAAGAGGATPEMQAAQIPQGTGAQASQGQTTQTQTASTTTEARRAGSKGRIVVENINIDISVGASILDGDGNQELERLGRNVRKEVERALEGALGRESPE